MEENKSIYQQTVDQIFGQLNQCVEGCRNAILEPKTFEMYYGGFMQIISQSISFFATPAIMFDDKEQVRHAIVAGEKWKLISRVVIPQDEIKFTNPLTMEADKAEVTQDACKAALLMYEQVYDRCLEKVMLINQQVLLVQAAPTNTAKLDAMRSVIESLEVIASDVNDYYQGPKKLN